MPQFVAQIPRRATDGAPCLSAAQRRLWIVDQLQPRDPSLNRPLAIRLIGSLDRQALQRALTEIVRRHHILRTVFPDAGGEPEQVVLAAGSVPLHVIDLQFVNPGLRETEARRIAAAESQQPFDLNRGPLLRAVLVQLDPQQHVLLVLMHHIVFDGWSEAIFLAELSAAYAAFESGAEAVSLPELPIQYADFAVWQQKRFEEGALLGALRYWKRRLEGIEPLLLPTDFARTQTPINRGAKHHFNLGPSVTKQLKNFSRREKVTLFMALLTAFQSLLTRYTGEHDIAVGIPVAGRPCFETEGLIGCFMNILVLRTVVPGNPSFRDFLAATRDAALDAYANQEAPLEKIVEELQPERASGRWPLFQVLFNFEDFHVPAFTQAGRIRIEPFPFDHGLIGGLDLSFDAAVQDGELHCAFNFPPALFRAETIQRMACHFETLVDEMVAQPTQCPSKVTLLTAKERAQLDAWRGTARSTIFDGGIHRLFEEQVRCTPAAPALVSGGRELTYLDLNGRANQVAHYLRACGVGPDTIVGVGLEKSIDMVVAIIGVLKAGGAYLPLEPTLPLERIAFMLADSRVSLMVTKESLGHKWISACASAAKGSLVLLDRDAAAIGGQSQADPANTIRPDNLAYVIYTSGSTGAPKGVMITHRAVCNHLAWRSDFFPLTPDDRVLQRSSLSFDDSVWELFESLSIGATVVLPDVHCQQDLGYLLRLIEGQRISATCFVPSLLQELLEHPEIGKCRWLRRLTTGAETLTAELRDRVLDCLAAEFYNGYGPTETTIAATFWACRQGGERNVVPIGRPIANTRVYILDADLNPVPLGLPGDLFIGGAGLARGYVNRPDLTAERFLPNPFSDAPGEHLYDTGDRGRYLADGSIEFLGRRDHQVKIRGFRIELQELESVILQHPNAKEAVAAATKSAAYDKRLVAYVVPREPSSFAVEGLRGFLAARVPDYMMPSGIIVLDDLPRLSGGKIDRQALSAIDLSSFLPKVTYVPPRTPTEKMLAQIWGELLGVSPVGIRDNFFFLGGHSLLAIRFISRLRATLGIDLPVRTLFENPTIADFAVVLTAQFADHVETLNLLQQFESLTDADAAALLGNS